MNIRKNTTDLCAELERIAKANNGQITPVNVLKNARSKSSPLHGYFTWDDGDAAEKYRLMEAGFLIRRVKVNVEMHDQDKPVSVRAFVNVSSNVRDDEGKSDAGVYVPLHVALKVDDYRQQMIDNAARELASFRTKYSIIKELSGVFHEADLFINQRISAKVAA